MNRRSFIKGLLATACAPAIVAAKPPEKSVTEIANKYHYGPNPCREVVTPATTNFAALSDESRALWSKALWNDARKQSYFYTF